MDRAEQSGAEQCWTGIMAQWSDCQLVSRDGQTTRKRTRIPSMAGSKGTGSEGRSQGSSKAGKVKGGQAKACNSFHLPCSSSSPLPFFYGFLSLLLRLIVVSCVVSDSHCVCLHTYVCECVFSPGADKSMSVFPIHCLFSLSAQRRINYSIV